MHDKDISFAANAAGYDNGFMGRLSRRFYALAVDNILLKDGASLLDVGCGTGALLEKLHMRATREHLRLDFFGIDYEPDMLAVAAERLTDTPLQLASASDMPYPDASFDIIVACMAYHHFSDKPRFAKEAHRILKSNGLLYIIDPLLPFVIRKPLNGLLKQVRVNGCFYTPEEISQQFCKHGFRTSRVCINGFAQLVELANN
jgi:ubiquinone/menaquinone biosynthesis C-methylase UbiE